MPLELPNLDDRTYDDLVQEALSLIPTYAPDWTNYNPSDPGITLIELFAYLTEMLLYRLNRVTDDTMLTFLTLLNGSAWVPTQDLREELRRSVLQLRSRYRAVTREDYELLSTEDFNRWLAHMQEAENCQDSERLAEWFNLTQPHPAEPSHQPSQMPFIRRAHCVVERNLSLPNEADRRQGATGHVSVVILPESSDTPDTPAPEPTSPPAPQPLAPTQLLYHYLDSRRLLTTRLHVVEPTYTPISAEIWVAHHADVRPEDLRRNIIRALNDFLSPLPVASSHTQGWPFGRDVYGSELYNLLETIPGVDYIPDLLLSSVCPEADPQCVAAEPLWNQDGDQVGLKLYDHHLPLARLSPDQLVIVPSTKFRVVCIHWRVSPVEGTDLVALKQQIKAAVRSLLSDQRQQPNPENQNPCRIEVEDNQNAIITLRITSLQRMSSSDEQYQDGQRSTKFSGPIPGALRISPVDFPTAGIRLYPDEVIDLRQQIDIEIL